MTVAFKSFEYFFFFETELGGATVVGLALWDTLYHPNLSKSGNHVKSPEMVCVISSLPKMSGFI